MTDYVWGEWDDSFSYDSLEDLRASVYLDVGDLVYRGVKRKPSTAEFVCVANVIDCISDAAFDEYGVEDYCASTSPEARQELKDVIAAWVDKHAPINFFAVDDIEEFVITADGISPV